MSGAVTLPVRLLGWTLEFSHQGSFNYGPKRIQRQCITVSDDDGTKVMERSCFVLFRTLPAILDKRLKNCGLNSLGCDPNSSFWPLD